MENYIFDTNYHTHTWRCGHAVGTEREYVESAIEAGFKILGFSDHTPQFFKGSYYSDEVRMRPNQLEDYVKTILDLKREYASDIEIKLGLEVEYYPLIFDKLMNELEQYPFDYFILGQHFTHNEYDGIYCGAATRDFSILQCYVSQVLEALSSGLFKYLAHPDLCNFLRDSEGARRVYDEQMTKMCTGIKQMGLPLEINMLGVWQHRWYPNEDFWRIAGKCGCSAVLGSDAHRADRIACGSWVNEAVSIAERNGVEVIKV